MITRKLLAALVGLSMAAGTLGTASAQTATDGAVPAQSVSPADATAPAKAAKTDPATKKTPAHVKHGARMSAKTHRKHVSKRDASRPANVASASTGKPVRISHTGKRGLSKHV